MNASVTDVVNHASSLISSMERPTTPPVTALCQNTSSTASLSRMNATLALQPLLANGNYASAPSLSTLLQESVDCTDNVSRLHTSSAVSTQISPSIRRNGTAAPEKVIKSSSSLSTTPMVDIHRNEFRIFFLSRLNEPLHRTAVPLVRRLNIYQTLAEHCRQMSLCDGVSHLVAEMKQLHDKINSAIQLQRHVDVGPSASNMLVVFAACIEMMDRVLQLSLPDETSKILDKVSSSEHVAPTAPQQPTANIALARISWVTSVVLYRLAALGHPRLWLSLFLAPEHSSILDSMSRIVGYLVILKKLSTVASSCGTESTGAMLLKEEEDQTVENHHGSKSRSLFSVEVVSASSAPVATAPSLSRASLKQTKHCETNNNNTRNKMVSMVRNRLEVEIAPYFDHGVPTFMASLNKDTTQHPLVHPSPSSLK